MFVEAHDFRSNYSESLIYEPGEQNGRLYTYVEDVLLSKKWILFLIGNTKYMS